MVHRLRATAGLTLEEAKDWLEDHVDEGAICPCCNQFAKVYRRKLNSGMARSLVGAYSRFRTRWIDITVELPSRSREEGKLVWWDMMEMSDRGIWRVTPKGADFVKGKIEVPRYAVVYNNRLLYLDTSETTDVRTALGDKFDYDELMKGKI